MMGLISGRTSQGGASILCCITLIQVPPVRSLFQLESLLTEGNMSILSLGVVYSVEPQVLNANWGVLNDEDARRHSMWRQRIIWRRCLGTCLSSVMLRWLRSGPRLI